MSVIHSQAREGGSAHRRLSDTIRDVAEQRAREWLRKLPPKRNPRPGQHFGGIYLPYPQVAVIERPLDD